MGVHGCEDGWNRCEEQGISNTSRRCSMMAQLTDPIDGRWPLPVIATAV